MPKKVFSDNITIISRDSFEGTEKPSVVLSDTPYLVGKTMSMAQSKIDDKSTSDANRRELIGLQAEFVKLVRAGAPEGYEFAGVQINPHTGNEASAVEEFESRVKGEFVKHVGEKFERQMLLSGVSKYAITLMQSGLLLPGATPYEVAHNIDVENSGKFATAKEWDFDNPRGAAQSFVVNHFNNLALMPKNVKLLKDTLTRIQMKLYDNAEPAFILSIVPLRDKKGEGFIAKRTAKSGKSMTDKQVIDETLKYIDSMKGRTILTEEFGRQALRNVNDELQSMLKKASQYTNEKTKTELELKDFFNGKAMRSVIAKVSGSDVDEAVALTKTAKQVSKLLKLEKKSSDNPTQTFKLTPKGKGNSISA